MTNTKPAARPACAHFSSGPCAKIPGWTPDLLKSDSLGRSHRSSTGKARLKRANDEAITAGVFGAPFFLVDGEPFWGNDRKAQIERWLTQGPF